MRQLLLALPLCLAGCTGEVPDEDTSASSDDSGTTDTDTSEEAVADWVDVGWLAEHLDEVVVIDVRDAESFAEGHVPGAANLPWDALRAEVDGIGGQVAAADDVEALLQQAGVSSDSRVVAYGGRHGRDVARLVWTLRYYGHDAVHMLDGSWHQWLGTGQASAVASATPTAGDWTAGPPMEELRRDADWIAEHLEDPDVVVLDVRTAEEYTEGHIPGALNVEWTANVHTSGEREGLLRSPEDLLALYPSIDLDDEVVVTCRSGARASLPWIALPTAGFTRVSLHDGSWNEWSAREDLPVETGAR